MKNAQLIRFSGRPKHARIPATDYSTGIHVFADGACDPNPGPGAWAFVVYADGVEAFSSSGAAPYTTNNRMEMSAVLAALEWIRGLDENPRIPVSLHSDSQYCVKGCNEWRHSWKKRRWLKNGADMPNADLWQLLDDALTEYPLKLSWVPGHSGIAGNERADRLAFEAMAPNKRKSA